MVFRLVVVFQRAQKDSQQDMPGIFFPSILQVERDRPGEE
jgi:hypothetical protein